MRTQKSIITLFVICITLLLTVGPLLSKDNDKGNNGRGNGHGSEQSQEHRPEQGHNNQQQSEEQSVPPTSAPVVNDLLGCQKNNPDRLDCSSLEVGGYCDGATAVFTIRNTGEPGNGDMRAATAYHIVVDGSVVESGSVQLAGGATTEIRYSGGGTATLEADQQVGHPGNSHPRVTLTCSAPTSTPEVTPEPTQDITPEPTQEVTPEPTTEVTPDPFNLAGDVYCLTDHVEFNVYNYGGAMPDPLDYSVFDENWVVIDQGLLQLGAGETLTIIASLDARVLNVGGGLLVLTIACAPATPEVTPDPYDLISEPYCTADGLGIFRITNIGAAMVNSLYYRIVDSYGLLIEDGWLWLDSGQTVTLGGVSGYLILNIADGLIINTLECYSTSTPEVTPEPTQEVTPEPTQEVTPEPTQEVTPEPTQEVTPEPTQEVTPEPTQEVTPEPTLPPLSCAKNNAGRLDCSSLEVTATCEGGTAVFTITNTGEDGDGDMRAPTEYRLLVGDQVVTTGAVDLDGRASMQVRYDGGGTVTLEADQQTGHPGGSQPQATITCG